MGLLRGMARTAVVAGTATAVSNRVSRRQAGRWQGEADQEAAAQQQQQQEAPPPQYAAAAPAQYAAPPPPPAPDPIAELQQLAQLKDQGILTEEEFTAKKKQVLGI
jgi:hypothetical protein